MKCFLVLFASLFVPVLADTFKGTNDIRHADREIMNIQHVECSELWFTSNSSDIHRLRLSETSRVELIVELNSPVAYDDSLHYHKEVGESVALKETKILRFEFVNRFK